MSRSRSRSRSRDRRRVGGSWSPAGRRGGSRDRREHRGSDRHRSQSRERGREGEQEQLRQNSSLALQQEEEVADLVVQVRFLGAGGMAIKQEVGDRNACIPQRGKSDMNKLLCKTGWERGG